MSHLFLISISLVIISVCLGISIVGAWKVRRIKKGVKKELIETATQVLGIGSIEKEPTEIQTAILSHIPFKKNPLQEKTSPSFIGLEKYKRRVMYASLLAFFLCVGSIQWNIRQGEVLDYGPTALLGILEGAIIGLIIGRTIFDIKDAKAFLRKKETLVERRKYEGKLQFENNV